MAYELNFGDSDFGLQKKKKLGELAKDGETLPPAETQPMNDPDFVLPADDNDAVLADPNPPGELADDTLPQSYPEDAPVSDPYPGGKTESEPFTYEQTYIDPYIEGIQNRTGATLGDVEVGAADVTQTSGYGLQDQSRQTQQSNLALLQTLAQGGDSRVIQNERERGIQAAMASAASVRGAPASAVQRSMNEQMAEVNRQAMEAGAKQQLDAQGMVNEFAGQIRSQDMSIMDLQANFMQQSGLTEAQMNSERSIAQVEINAQLETARDAKINELIGMGVDRNVAMLQISADMDKLEKELNYKYWAGKTGTLVEAFKVLAEQKGETEDLHEQMREEAAVFNIFGNLKVPEGYSVSDVEIGEGQGEGYAPTPYSESTTQGDAPATGGQYVWNFETQQYDWTAPDQSPGSTTVSDQWGEIEGSPGALRQKADDLANEAASVAAVHGVNSEEAIAARARADAADEAATYAESQNEEVSGAEAKLNVVPVGQKDEFGRTREADPYGQMGFSPEFRSSLDPTDPNTRISQMRGTGSVGPGVTDFRKLGEARRGLQPSYQESQQKLSDAIDSSRDRSSNFGEGYQQGKQDVSDYMQYGQIGYLGGQLVSSDKEERERASKELIGLGVAKTIQGGVQGVEAFFKAADASKDAINSAVSGIYGSNIRSLSPEISAGLPADAIEGVSETIDQVATGVESAVASEGTGVLKTLGATAEAVKEGTAKAATSAAPYAPYIGGAVQFGSAIGSGGEIAPSLVKAAGATAGGVGGASAGGALGGAIGSIFPGIGTAIGAGVGSAVGGAAGAMGGGAIASPLANSLGTMRHKRGQTPLGAISDPSELIGAPSIYSGKETKLQDTIEGVSSNIEPYFNPSASASAMKRGPMGTQPYYGGYNQSRLDKNYGDGFENSGAETKSNAGPVQDDDLANFMRDLDPVKYDYRPEYGGEKGQYGFIAQDAKFKSDGSLDPVGKTFVRQKDDGTHVIDTGKATMVNMAASANQQQAIDKQGLLIAELLKKQAMLEGRI